MVDASASWKVNKDILYTLNDDSRLKNIVALSTECKKKTFSVVLKVVYLKTPCMF